MRPSLLPAAMIAPTLQVATYSLPPRAVGLAFPISYNILEALFVGSPGENILPFWTAVSSQPIAFLVSFSTNPSIPLE